MTKINFRTKKIQHFWNRYEFALRHNITTLHNVYKNPSAKKLEAYNSCRKTFSNLNGRDFVIISSNNFSFTVAFIYREDGRKWFLVETRSGQYISEIKED